MKGATTPRQLLDRNARPLILDTLADTPITVIQGARQVGKSTIVKQIVNDRGGVLVSLDDAGVLAAVQADPDGFLALGQGEFLAIDEVQRAPELVRALKSAVDADRRAGCSISSV